MGGATFNLNGGTLNVGSSGTWTGITTDGKTNVKVNLNSGTIGSLSDSWSSSMNFALGGQITIDTTKKEISDTGKATEVEGQTGSTVTLSGVLSNATDATASLVKEGLGTLVLSGTNTFTGGVTIKAGTLVAGNASALGSGAVTVANGATLDVSGFEGALNIGALTTGAGTVLNLGAVNTTTAKIVSTGAVTLDAGTIFDIASIEDGLKLISGTSFSVADGLSIANLLVDGKLVNQRGEATFTVTDSVLTLNYTAGAAATLTWNGDTTGGTWDVNQGTTWTADGLTSPTFQHGDSVIFNTDGLNLTLNETVAVGGMTVNQNMTLAGTGTIEFGLTPTLTGATNKTITLGKDITLSALVDSSTISDEATETIDFSPVSGNGVVDIENIQESFLNLREVAVKVADGFSGTLKLTNVQLDLASQENATTEVSSIGKAVVNLNNAALSFRNHSQTFANEVVIDEGKTGYFRVWNADDTHVEISGKVSGAGTLQVMDGGQTTFLGTVNVGTLNMTAGTTNFSGTTDITTANISAGTTNFSGTTNIATMDMTGGTTSFSGNSAFVGEVNASSGTSTLTGTVTIGDADATEKVNVLRSTGGTLNIENATLNLNGHRIAIRGAGTINQKSGTINAESLRLHDEAAVSGASTYNLSGGVLNLSSTNKDKNTSSGVLIGHWGGGNDAKGILNVTDGVLNAKDTIAVVSWDSAGEFSISGGEVNLHGIALTSGRNFAATVTLSGSGRLNIGAGGLSGSANNKVYNFNGGTLGALDNWSTTSALKIGGNVTIDTVKRTVSQTGASEAQTGDTAAATITLSGILSDGDAVGKLIKEGVGTLILNAANTFTGGVTINAGTVQAGNASALGTGTVKIDGGQLNVANVDLNKTAIEIVLSDKYKSDGGVAAITGTTSNSSIADGTTITLSKSADLALELAAETALSFSVADSNLAGSFVEGDFKLGADWVGWEIADYANGVITLNKAVPEPSMFGLLAGLGALALVGARRRRKTK